MEGTVFNIQRFSVHDGPGIRTNVFLKGCPLRCIWCHNPEGLSRKCTIEYSTVKCIGCLECVSACPEGAHFEKGGLHGLDFSKCAACFKCVSVCPAGAVEQNGILWEDTKVIDEVERDRAYYGDRGGMTLSGGEPFYQPEFAISLLKKAKERGINTAVETCGLTSFEIIAEAAKYTDIFLYDCKATDPVLHKEVTGADMDVITENLKLLDTLGAHVVLRCPIIPGINNNDDHYKNIADRAKKYKCIKEINIMPYHSYGEGKRAKLGMEKGFVTEPLTAEEINHIREAIVSYTDIPVEVM